MLTNSIIFVPNHVCCGIHYLPALFIATGLVGRIILVTILELELALVGDELVILKEG